MGWLKVTVENKIDDESDDSSQGGSEPELKKVPCPGITVSDDPWVLQYLKRTGASGGGGRSLAVIAKQVYKKLFSQLSKKTNKKVVVDKQMQEWKWKNDHMNHRVSRLWLTGCLSSLTHAQNAASSFAAGHSKMQFADPFQATKPVNSSIINSEILF